MNAKLDAMAAPLRALWPKLPDLVDLGMVGVLTLSFAVSVLRQSFVLVEFLLTASVMGFALAYLMASRSLRRRKVSPSVRIFTSLCVMVSSVWLFEIVYYLWGWEAWAKAPEGLFTFRLTTPVNDYNLSWALLMVGLAMVGVRYMGPNKWFLAAVGLAI